MAKITNSNYAFLEKSIENREKVLHGFDIELGGNLPNFKPLEAFISYYHFNSTNIKPVHGIRIRSNLRLNEYISLEGEISHDRLRKDQTGKDLIIFGGIKLQYSFGKKQSH